MTDKEIIRAEIEKRLNESIENEWLTEIAEYESLLSFIDSIQVNPCDGCTNRKGCVTCENGELKETELAHLGVINICDQKEPLEKEIEKYLEGFIETPTKSYFRDTIRYFYRLGKEQQSNF